MILKYQMTCPSCGHQMQIDAGLLGQTGKCPACNTSFHMAMSTVDTALNEGPALETVSAKEDPDGIPAEWQVGNVFLNLYSVTNVLGEGGMGKVYKVHHLRWDIDLAVKSPRPKLLQNKAAMEAFQRECETWVNLGLHPQIVSCYYVRQLGGLPRIFAEYVDSGSLWRWVLNGKLYRGGPQKALEHILTIGVHIAWGLHHAHENGLIHRDVKSANVLMTKTGLAKVTDFGLASARLKASSLADEEPLDNLASVGGMTPAYCSPEQAAYQKVSRTTDIWSWALCLLEMLGGGMTWSKGPEAPRALDKLLDKGPPHASIPAIPDDLAALLHRCCSEDPQARPADMVEVCDAIREIYANAFGRPFQQHMPRSVGGRAESLNNRAVSFIDLGKSDEASTAWTTALRLEPKHPESTFNLGLTRWRAGRLSDEVFAQQMAEVVSMHPGEVQPQSLLAQIHLERGDCESVIAALGEHGKGPETPEALRGPLTIARERLPLSRRLLGKIKGHADVIRGVRLSANGSRVLTSSIDNTVRLWEIPSGSIVHTLTGHTSSIEAACFCRGDALALSGGRDHCLRLWDLQSGRCLQQRSEHTCDIVVVCAARASDIALSADQDGRIVFWRVEGENLRNVFEERRSEEITTAAVSPDGTLALFGHRDGTLRLWDLTTMDFVRAFKAHEGPVDAVALSPQGIHALSGGEDHCLHVWDVWSGACIRSLHGHTDTVTSVALSGDARMAASGSVDMSVRLWDLASGRCLRTYRGHNAEVRSVDITQTGHLIASGSRDGALALWDTGRQMPPFHAPLALCQALPSETALSTEMAFARSLDQARRSLTAGDAVACARHVRQARSHPGFRRNAAAMDLWGELYLKLPRTAFAGAWEGETMKGHIGLVRAIDLGRDGRLLLSGGDDGALRLWNTTNGRCVRTFEGHTGPIRSVCLSSHATFALSASADNTIRFWDLVSGSCRRVFEERADSVESVALSPDDRYAVSGGWNITLWDVATGRCMRSFGGQTGAVFTVAWGSDGAFVLSGSSEETARLWDVARGVCTHVFQGQSGVVRSVALSADGRLAISGSSSMWNTSGQLVLWDAPTGTPLRGLAGHAGGINAVCLSSDGCYALSGSSDNTVRLWDTHTGVCTRVLTEHMSNPQAVRLSCDNRIALAADASGLIQTWVLDWDLADEVPLEMPAALEPFFDAFIYRAHPYAAALAETGPIGAAQAQRALSRKGEPSWTDAEFEGLLHTLACAGYGWIPREDVRRQLGRRVHKSVFQWLAAKLGLGRPPTPPLLR